MKIENLTDVKNYFIDYLKFDTVSFEKNDKGIKLCAVKKNINWFDYRFETEYEPESELCRIITHLSEQIQSKTMLIKGFATHDAYTGEKNAVLWGSAELI